eukprot:jgi/Botrbrau1/14850/Bobra.0326s0004.1
MNFYPPELVTPPLALVVFLGCPEVHSSVGEFLRSHHKPPMNSLGVADPLSAPRLFGERKQSLVASAAPAGILKADWLQKHRTRRPSVALLFLHTSAVAGDPNAWAGVCRNVDTVRGATRSRGIRLVVVLVQTPEGGPITEDRLTALTRQAGIERKWVLGLDPGEGDAGLKRLGRALYEAAGSFYLDDARRRLAIQGERRQTPPALAARSAFKAAALAEFRVDWATAVKTYQTAYAEVAKVGLLTASLPYQSWYELTSVAEQLHLKVVTLLLHQHRAQEALLQFRSHLGLFKKLPFQKAPEALLAAHWGWLGRQYAVMAELLASRVAPDQLPPQRDCSPAFFYLCAANAAIEERRALQRLRERTEGSVQRDPVEGIQPGAYVGQLVVREPPRRLTEPEFIQYLEGVQRSGAGGKPPGSTALERLRAAHEVYSRGGPRSLRLSYHIGALMAREQLVADDPASARRLLDSVAGIYRREGWEVPLAAVLMELRECAQRLNLVKDHATYSLELASLPQCLDAAQRTAIGQAAITALLEAPPGSLSPAPAPAAAPASPTTDGSPGSAGSVGSKEKNNVDGPVTNLGFEHRIKPVGDSLLSVLAMCAGFRLLPGGAPRSKTLAHFGVAVYSNLLTDLPLTALEVIYTQGETTRRVPVHVGPPGEGPHSPASPSKLEGKGTATAPVPSVREDETGSVEPSEPRSAQDSEAELDGAPEPPGGPSPRSPGREQNGEVPRGAHEPPLENGAPPPEWELRAGVWKAGWALLQMDGPAAVHVTHIVAYLGKQAAFVWHLPSFPSGGGIIGKGPGGIKGGRSPFRGHGADVGPGRWEWGGAQLHDPPSLWVEAPRFGLVGEPMRVAIKVKVGDPLGKPTLLLQTSVKEEGGTKPVLRLLAPVGTHPAGGAVGGSLELPDQAAGAEVTVLLEIGAERAGHVSLTVQLLYLPGEVKGEPLQAGVSVEIAVERPFRVACRLQTLPGRVSLLLPSPPNQDAGALPVLTGKEHHLVPLPQKEVCLLLVQLRTSAACPLLLAGANVDPKGAGNNGVELLGVLPDLEAGSPVQLEAGDGLTLICRLRRDSPGWAVPIGDLRLIWQRRDPPESLISRPEGAAEEVEVLEPAPGPLGDPLQVVTQLRLPPLDWCEPVLAVEAEVPEGAICGVPFSVLLRISNRTLEPLDLSITCLEAPSILFAGRRVGQETVLPLEEAVIPLQLVAYQAGALQLPPLTLTLARHGAELEALHGRTIFVSPDSTVGTA